MSDLKVLFLASEADPIVKVGGLGDVAGSLPPALRALDPLKESGGEFTGIDIRLVIPLHGVIQRQNYSLVNAARLEVQSANGPIPADVFSVLIQDLPVYMISGPPIRPNTPVYTADASEDGMKYTFFSLAALELARAINWTPHLVQANDWHTAPAIYAIHLNRERDPFYYNTATVLGLHNLPYLGAGAEPALAAFNLPPAVDSALPAWAQGMPLPLGLLAADHIVAVSPTYAKEILTPEFGSGLHDFLISRADSISGILNGLDIKRWDPQNDSGLVANFDSDHLERRYANKTALQEEFGLEPDPATTLLAMITRLDYQKGVDLLPDALRQLRFQNWQAIVLGTGTPSLEGALRGLELEFPQRLRAAIRFDMDLSRRVYAGADALLIPSRYEPCGLTQMIAMRYGCVPVARSTGGLKDTIRDFGTSKPATGFLFQEPDSNGLADAISRCLELFPDQEAWRELQRRGMAQDFSWEHSARQYLQLYLSMVKARHPTY
jgi:starch synthase